MVKKHFVSLVLSACLLTSLTNVQADGIYTANDIRLLYQGYEITAPSSSKQAFIDALEDYKEIREEYLQKDLQYKSLQMMQERVQKEYNSLLEDAEEHSKTLLGIEEKLHRAVELEADFDTLVFLDNKCRNQRKLLEDNLNNQTILESRLLSLSSISNSATSLSEEVNTKWELVHLLQREYAKSSGLINIGDIKPVNPTSVNPPRFTSLYGYRIGPSGRYENHTGLDFAASYGSPVKAIYNGYVTYSGWKGSYGYCVIIDHGGGIKTLYAHASQNRVSVNDYVEQGQTVQLAGSTGYSTGTHVHLSITIDGVFYNPGRIFS